MLLQTERTKIRKLTIDDAPSIYKLMNTKDWIQYIGDRNINTVSAAANYLKMVYLPMYLKGAFGPYAIISKEDERFIGSIGLYKRQKLAIPDLGFAVLPQYYKKGYSYEASVAMLKHAKGTLGFREVAAIVTNDNRASTKLLEKLGFKDDGTYIDEKTKEELRCLKCII